MKTRCPRIVSSLAGAVICLAGLHAQASPYLATDVIPPYQVGNGASVRLGHVVHAYTYFNRLTAGGTFSAACVNPEMSPYNGQREASDWNVTGGLWLHVTIPLSQPALVNMPGFYNLPRGTTVSCTYNWTSRAVESGYSISPGGISIPIGSGSSGEGGTQIFYMSVPADTNTGDWQKCIP